MQADSGHLFNRNCHAALPRRQLGIALIIGLVILAVLSMIGVAAFSISTQEERMAGNSRDRMLAFEAAEAALRACEDYVKTGPVFGATAGMYLAKPSDQATYAESIDWSQSANVYIDPNLQAAQSASANKLPWSRVPACVAEQFQVVHGGAALGEALTLVPTVHITSQGYGLNSSTVVRLESYYAP
jgi:Tfp pilus assembly protein PilX